MLVDLCKESWIH